MIEREPTGVSKPSDRYGLLWADRTRTTAATVLRDFLIIWYAVWLAEAVAHEYLDRGEGYRDFLVNLRARDVIGIVDGIWEIWDKVAAVCGLACGIVVWRRPHRARAVATLTCLLWCVGAVFPLVFDARGMAVVGFAPVTARCGSLLCDVPYLAMPGYLLWRIRRDRYAGVAPIQLVARLLVIHGGLGCAGSALEGGASPWFPTKGSQWTMYWFSASLFYLVCLLCGIWLLTGRGRAIRPAAWMIGCVAVAVFCGRLGPIKLIANSYIAGLHYFLVMAPQTAVSVGLLAFVIRYRPRAETMEPVCWTCGYSLRGLPRQGHRCPECGTPYGNRATTP